MKHLQRMKKFSSRVAWDSQIGSSLLPQAAMDSRAGLQNLQPVPVRSCVWLWIWGGQEKSISPIPLCCEVDTSTQPFFWVCSACRSLSCLINQPTWASTLWKIFPPLRSKDPFWSLPYYPHRSASSLCPFSRLDIWRDFFFFFFLENYVVKILSLPLHRIYTFPIPLWIIFTYKYYLPS